MVAKRKIAPAADDTKPAKKQKKTAADVETGHALSPNPDAPPADPNDDPTKFYTLIPYPDSEKIKDVYIDTPKLCNYLNAAGNWLYSKEGDQKNYEFINIQDNTVDNTNEFSMKKATLTFLATDPPLAPVYKKILGGSKQYFGPHILEGLPFITAPVFIKDTYTRCYHFYRNTAVKITKDNPTTATTTTVPYTSLTGYVWRHQIIDRDYAPVQDYSGSDFCRFITMAATGRHYNEIENFTPEENTRILSMCTTLGYLMHSYKDPSCIKMVISVDGRIGDTDQPNGRSGKNLFVKAIDKIIRTHLIDGRLLKTTSEHPFSGLKPGTRLLNFSDLRANFDLGWFFNMASDGLSYNEKNKQITVLTPEESPKIYISMNHLPKGEADSFISRQHIIEFGEYFTAARQPKDIFGRNFFMEDWPAEQWNLFDNFMMDCARLYLEMGLVPFPAMNFSYKKLRTQMPEEVRDFFEPTDDAGKPLPERYQVSEYPNMEAQDPGHVNEYNKADEYAIFLSFKEEFSAHAKNTFTGFLKAWASYKGWDINPHKKGGRDARGGKDYFRFYKKK